MWSISPQRGYMKCLANFMSPIEAHIILGRMLSEGIYAQIIDDGVVWNNYMCSHAFGGVKLLVHDSEHKRAEEILSGIYDNQYLLNEKNPEVKSSVSMQQQSNSSALCNTTLVILLFLTIGVALPLKFNQ
ncbi:hypothetical protein [Xenorhabdus innexi]|uniref:DUF2007 domain-containing protein n=1 Tax=Xenorhabdus innexi TaxID=290109 RepID=A0A1N6N1I0_9GAMM|nr:hypothetical protein [Xenorhabdus innexi]PHM37021.1 hypothetical protein Xinn_01292 [Xenorhabdus innexi]SIP74935.1 conserved hypothetical protein [Xenorhabdus innexi]